MARLMPLRFMQRKPSRFPGGLVILMTFPEGQIKPAAEAKGIQIEIVLDVNTERVFGDSNRLQQVVWNLLSNAVKFTPEGGRVQVTLKSDNSHARIVVSDTGAGISPEFLPHMFEPFRQSDGS